MYSKSGISSRLPEPWVPVGKANTDHPVQVGKVDPTGKTKAGGHQQNIQVAIETMTGRGNSHIGMAGLPFLSLHETARPQHPGR